ncbi:MAG: hypothetical protein JJU36_01685 [Phycisphaeraceae bacterium]|nr:hypothetical protein [Phycisphaeraceae bacterium]
MPQPKPQIVVFSDDWGRHPSSSQHLARYWLDDCDVIWVNTIGTRLPGLNREDIAKVWAKLKAWLTPRRASDTDTPTLETVPGPRIISPRMYPGFRTGWQRRLNRRLISRAVNQALASITPQTEQRPPRIVMTTIPLVADLPGSIEVDHWVYYCVDDFSVWPGLDGTVMDAMERELVGKIDLAVAVSPVLVDRLAGMGCRAELLTHGIDPDHWAASDPDDEGTPAIEDSRLPDSPFLLFWGYVDQRLDADWCLAAAEQCGGLLLAGPRQNPDPRLLNHPNIRLCGPIAYERLPALARQAGALVMPYADLPVTRAMQPLKFKEYLATGRPVVVRKLPATEGWEDCCDVVDQHEAFLAACRRAVQAGEAEARLHRRRERLADESWRAKSRHLLERMLAIRSPNASHPG